MDIHSSMFRSGSRPQSYYQDTTPTPEAHVRTPVGSPRREPSTRRHIIRKIFHGKDNISKYDGSEKKDSSNSESESRKNLSSNVVIHVHDSHHVSSSTSLLSSNCLEKFSHVDFQEYTVQSIEGSVSLPSFVSTEAGRLRHRIDDAIKARQNNCNLTLCAEGVGILVVKGLVGRLESKDWLSPSGPIVQSLRGIVLMDTLSTMPLPLLRTFAFPEDSSTRIDVKFDKVLRHILERSNRKVNVRRLYLQHGSSPSQRTTIFPSPPQSSFHVQTSVDEFLGLDDASFSNVLVSTFTTRASDPGIIHSMTSRAKDALKRGEVDFAKNHLMETYAAFAEMNANIIDGKSMTAWTNVLWEPWLLEIEIDNYCGRYMHALRKLSMNKSPKQVARPEDCPLEKIASRRLCHLAYAMIYSGQHHEVVKKFGDASIGKGSVLIQACVTLAYAQEGRMGLARSRSLMTLSMSGISKELSDELGLENASFQSSESEKKPSTNERMSPRSVGTLTSDGEQKIKSSYKTPQKERMSRNPEPEFDGHGFLLEAQTCRLLGDYVRGYKVSELALQTFENSLGRSHRKICEAMVEKAHLLCLASNDLEGAMTLLNEAFSRALSSVGELHPIIQKARFVEVVILRRQSYYPRAIDRATNLVKEFGRDMPSHPLAFEARLELAKLRRLTADFAMATNILQNVLDESQNPDQSRTVWHIEALQELAHNQVQQGLFSMGESTAVRSLSLRSELELDGLDSFPKSSDVFQGTIEEVLKSAMKLLRDDLLKADRGTRSNGQSLMSGAVIHSIQTLAVVVFESEQDLPLEILKLVRRWWVVYFGEMDYGSLMATHLLSSTSMRVPHYLPSLMYWTYYQFRESLGPEHQQTLLSLRDLIVCNEREGVWDHLAIEAERDPEEDYMKAFEHMKPLKEACGNHDSGKMQPGSSRPDFSQVPTDSSHDSKEQHNGATQPRNPWSRAYMQELERIWARQELRLGANHPETSKTMYYIIQAYYKHIGRDRFVDGLLLDLRQILREPQAVGQRQYALFIRDRELESLYFDIDNSSDNFFSQLVRLIKPP